MAIIIQWRETEYSSFGANSFTLVYQLILVLGRLINQVVYCNINHEENNFQMRTKINIKIKIVP